MTPARETRTKNQTTKMKLQAFAICGLLAAPLVFAGGGKEQIQHEKRFGEGYGMPAFLAVYDVLDAQGNPGSDGVLCPEEQQAMKQAREQISKQVRTDWDENGDGQICVNERARAQQRLREMIDKTRADRFWEAEDDDDGDEVLSYEEFAELPGIAQKLEDGKTEIVDAIFDKLSGDDDFITLTEFLDAIGACDQPRDGTGPNCPNPR